MSKNTLCRMLGLVLALLLFVNCALANGALPRADAVFSSTEISLSTKMNASFTAQTKVKASEIKVTEIKDGSKWVDDGDLPPPSKNATDTTRYTASKDYSGDCTSGNTYRIKAVFDADGHTITAYSNSVNY